MKQALVKKGIVVSEEIPAPRVSDGALLIKVVNSCISAGTEMSGVSYSGKPLIKRALGQPAQVAKVWKMARSIGITKTVARIKGVLDSGQATGYSVAGIVIGVGKGVKAFKEGDRVAAAGAGLANHAEFVDVPENLVMKVPDGLDFAKASTVTLGGIALQGVRRMELSLGEYAVVVGGGILGLLAMQILRLAGVRVCVVDLDEKRLGIARDLGAEISVNPAEEDPVKAVDSWTAGYGTDAVLFAAATGSSDPLSQAFQMCKRKGKVVLLGVSGMQIRRDDMYAKELDFLISTSYGPGRYDRNYEEKGLDYPYGYVRWTENRNMSEYLRLLARNAVDVAALIHKIYPIDEVTAAFDSLNAPQDKPLMVLLDYGSAEKPESRAELARKVSVRETATVPGAPVRIGLIGAGEFAKSMHLPNIERMAKKFKLQAVMSRTGHKAKGMAQQYGAVYAATDYEAVLSDSEVDMVMITTRHDSHAELTLKALAAGKHVFVEKPLAIKPEELKAIKEFYRDGTQGKPVLMVGFNRRFSQYACEIRRHTDKRVNPLFISYRMNAGNIPLDSWQHEDGGRLIGEGCHIIDLMSSFTGARLKTVCYEGLTPKNEKLTESDNRSMILKYADGSVCTVLYFAVGSTEFPKEHMEVHFDEKTIVMDDYKTLTGYGIKVKEIKTESSEKGQAEELEAFFDALKDPGGQWPIALEDMIQTTEVTFAIENKM